jgi:hypothetical protein
MIVARISTLLRNRDRQLGRESYGFDHDPQSTSTTFDLANPLALSDTAGGKCCTGDNPACEPLVARR